MRFLLAAFFALALAGCATGPVSLPVDNLAGSAKVPLQDLRPAGEGTREIFSLMITSERYGYARLAEDLTEPSGPRLLAHRLQEKYGSSTVPPTKLHHFVVYLNNRSELRTVAVGAAFAGAVGAVIASGTVKREGDIVHTSIDAASFDALSGDNEYKRALYTDGELNAGTSALVVFIESESAGKRRFTRTVSPLKPARPGEKVPLHVALEAAIQHHLRE